MPQNGTNKLCGSWSITTKREMLAVVAMCIQFRSYLRGARFTLRTDHKSLVWLHRLKYTEGMLSRWLHYLQQFQFSIIHRPGKDHGNADGLSRAPSSPCRQCTRPDCPPATLIHHDSDQPFDSCLDGQLGGCRFGTGAVRRGLDS